MIWSFYSYYVLVTQQYFEFVGASLFDTLEYRTGDYFYNNGVEKLGENSLTF